MQEPLTETAAGAKQEDAQLPPLGANVSISTSPDGSDAAAVLKGEEHPHREPENFPRTTHSPNSQFYHFMRLMQLFPSVHPATLHSVMAMCQNDFLIAVDRLLYARRRKEQRQQHMDQNGYGVAGSGAGKGNRYMPYPCAMSCLSTGDAAVRVMQMMRPQMYKLETKKAMAARSKSKMAKAQLHVLQQQPLQQIELQPAQQLQFKIEENAPLTLQCSVPLRSISPDVPEDLSTHENDHLQFAEEVVEDN